MKKMLSIFGCFKNFCSITGWGLKRTGTDPHVYFEGLDDLDALQAKNVSLYLIANI